MRDRAAATLELRAELRQTAEQPELRLGLVYQPVISLETGAAAGFEAFLCWHHPAFGTVSLGRLLQLVEETGLSLPIGWWTVREACAQMAAWHQSLYGVPPPFLCVNLSAEQLAQPDVVARLASILVETGLRPEYLRIGLSVEAFKVNAESVEGKLIRMEQMNVLSQVVLGAELASFSCLRGFALGALKLDISLLEEENSEVRSIERVADCLDLARDLGLEVIADGVESPQQAAQLIAFRCRLAQGIFFSGPLAGDAVGHVLAQRLRW